ncbi:MAG: DUF4316 domain-containing protein [Oscillospiraceae bacterium]|nr:DUF4316 domain-containing protein [Oscillospiraceae bacterium]
MIDDIEKNYAEVRKERGLDNEVAELDEAMFENSVNYLHIQKSEEAWDYSVYDKESLKLVDGGRIENPKLNIGQIKEQITSAYEVKLPYGEPLPNSDKNRLLDDITEKAALQMTQEYQDLPDPKITISDMCSYGYTDSNMLPIPRETALKLFDADAAIYMLHYDDTEAMVTDVSEIKNFDGIFGIDKEDWQLVKDNYLKNAEMSIEDDYDMIDGIVNNGDNRSVAELESDVKAGKSISVLDLANAINRESEKEKPVKQAKSTKRDKAAKSEKSSLLAKLNRPLPPQQDKDKPKNKEMEM